MSNFWVAVIAIWVMVWISDLFTSVYLHRAMTHKGIRLHPFPAWVMKLWLWLLIGQVVRNWVAVHRKHHKYPDKPGDPHSPNLLGLWPVLFFNVVYYAKTLAEDKEILEKYAPDVPRRKSDVIFDNFWFGYAAGLILFIIGFGFWLGFSWMTPLYALIAYLAHLIIYFMTLSIINGVCHKVGYQNFHEEDNLATNMPLFGVLVAGEVWHNNHHHDPFSPKIGYRWWEIDPGWILIKMLMWCSLAKQSYMTIKEQEIAKTAKTL